MPAGTIIDRMTDPNTCFLFGAGSSKCAGKPLMRELTEAVKKDVSAFDKVLDDLKGENDRDATVEDLMNYLKKKKKLASSRKKGVDLGFSLDDIETGLKNIQASIVKHLGGKWTPYDVHKKFFRRLSGLTGTGTQDIFTLNYDTVIEASLEDLQLPYTDGFRGADNAYFDPELYEQVCPGKTLVKLYKLHGSVNWVRDPDGNVRRIPVGLTNKQPVVVYPAEQKYVQTQYGVYEKLLALFRERMRDQERKNNTLIVCGYSFSDEHINVAIEDSIRSPGSNLTVFAFVGAGSNPKAQKTRLQGFADRCDDRFNALIGGDVCIGNGFEGDQKAIFKRELWKFENLVDLVVEGR